MIRTLAALALASATAATAGTSSSADTLKSNVPWWEKVTVTMTGDGEPASCSYESSLRAMDPSACDVKSEASATGAGSSDSKGGSKSELTRITFERQFLPGLTEPGEASLTPGDTLLARQVLAIHIDPAGAVKGCQVVAKSGDLTPEYGCDEAKTERFEANSKAAATHRQGFMTVLVYGHEEHVA